LPISTEAESKLYIRCKSEAIRDPEEICGIFNKAADGQNIFFKTVSHITNHETVYKRSVNRKRTMADIDLDILEENTRLSAEIVQFEAARERAILTLPSSISLSNDAEAALTDSIQTLIQIVPPAQEWSGDPIRGRELLENAAYAN
jgi:hypothetical protein